MEIIGTTKSFIVENFFLGRQTAPLAHDTSFLGMGLLDSTGVIELVSFLEQSFQIKVQDDEMIPENFDSLARIERYVRAKLNSESREAVS